MQSLKICSYISFLHLAIGHLIFSMDPDLDGENIEDDLIMINANKAEENTRAATICIRVKLNYWNQNRIIYSPTLKFDLGNTNAKVRHEN